MILWSNITILFGLDLEEMTRDDYLKEHLHEDSKDGKYMCKLVLLQSVNYLL